MEFSFIPLCDMLAENNFEKDNHSMNVIRYTEEYIIDNKLLTVNQLNEWNKKVVEYLVKKGMRTLKDFVETFKLSKIMKKFNLPHSKFENEAQKDYNEWQKIIEDLNSTTVKKEDHQ